MEDSVITILQVGGSVIGGMYAAKFFSYYVTLKELRNRPDSPELREVLRIRKLITLYPFPVDLVYAAYKLQQIYKSHRES